MGGELVLASKWDTAFDVVRFLYVGFFSDLPAWARYTVLALFGLSLVGGFVSWLRKRSASAPEERESGHGDGEAVDGADGTVRGGAEMPDGGDGTVRDDAESVHGGETRVR